MVLKKLEDLELDFTEKNIDDAGIAEELVSLGGKDQVPYLVDSEKGSAMYESSAIIDHLNTHYGLGPMPEDDPMAA